MAKINLNQPFYSYPVDKVVDSVQTNLNELEKEENESIWEKINEQFEDNLVRILLLAGVMILFQICMQPFWVMPCVIFTILILTAAVDKGQDLDAEIAIEVKIINKQIIYVLKDLQFLHAIVLRDEVRGQIEVKDLVIGDQQKLNKEIEFLQIQEWLN